MLPVISTLPISHSPAMFLISTFSLMGMFSKSVLLLSFLPSAFHVTVSLPNSGRAMVFLVKTCKCYCPKTAARAEAILHCLFTVYMGMVFGLGRTLDRELLSRRCHLPLDTWWINTCSQFAEETWFVWRTSKHSHSVPCSQIPYITVECFKLSYDTLKEFRLHANFHYMPSCSCLFERF